MQGRRFLTAFLTIQILAFVVIGLLVGEADVSLIGFALLSTLATGSMIFWRGRQAARETQTLVRFADQIGKGKRQSERGPRFLSQSGELIARALGEAGDETESRIRILDERISQMESMLAGMIEGVVVTDADGRVVFANEAACAMVSRSREELIGYRLLDQVRYLSLRTAVEESQLTRTTRTTELETINNPRRLIVANVSPINAPSRGGLAIVLHDVTEVRKLETMRRDFVANVSHELKTPLSVIKACAETLLMGALHDDQANTGFVQQIEDQAEMLDQQVQRLLELSQAQSGQAIIDIQPVDLAGACRQVVESFHAEAEKRQLTLVADTPDSFVVDTDEDAVHTVLNNLVSNALRYTPIGGSVVVRTRKKPGQAIIEVADTGIGIAADARERVFERFFRVDKARSRDQGGTGLGLAIVKHRMQALGGSVELESQVGKGSTFRVRFPVPEQTGH